MAKILVNKGVEWMDTYHSTRHAKFLLNYHFIWIPKYGGNILKEGSYANNLCIRTLKTNNK